MWNLLRKRGRHAPCDAELARAPAATARYVVIDTELTGLDERSDAVLSIGGICAPGGRLDLARQFYREVRPSRDLDARSILVHGITPSDLRDKPPIGAVLEEFLAFCGADILVGHFIGIDLLFLRKELATCPGRELRNRAVDTWFLYEWMRCRQPRDGGAGFPAVRDPRLFEVARALGVEITAGHNALRDAYTTGLVFQRLLRRAGRWGLHTVEDLLRAGDPGSPLHHHHNGAAPPLN